MPNILTNILPNILTIQKMKPAGAPAPRPSLLLRWWKTLRGDNVGTRQKAPARKCERGLTVRFGVGSVVLGDEGEQSCVECFCERACRFAFVSHEVVRVVLERHR